ncbi:MAG: hypothetical protein AAF933_10770 [Pseudomonadota bacterium]
MTSLPILPEDLAQLIKFVPSRGWDALEWRPLLSRLRSISVQLATRRGVAGLATSVASATTAVSVAPAPKDARSFEELNSRQHRAAGDKILHFYFAQFRNGDGLFLDLRPARFAWQRGRLHFSPTGLYGQLSPGFREGMMDLYRGFYLPDEKLLDDAMYRLGFLYQDQPSSEATTIRRLLRDHFGGSMSAQRFRIDKFQASFDTLFGFFVDNDYRLQTDFVLLCFYLITLYLSLDRLGTRHDVKAICLEELAE